MLTLIHASLVSGYHAIGRMHDKPDEEEEVVAERGGVRAFDMPELIHNLNLLVDMTEEDIVLNERRYGIVILEDTVVNE